MKKHDRSESLTCCILSSKMQQGTPKIKKMNCFFLGRGMSSDKIEVVENFSLLSSQYFYLWEVDFYAK
jgi:hypothetical protein